MAKFKSVLHEKARDSHGGLSACGVSVLVPLDDAAAIRPIAERAEQMIDPKTNKPYWTRKEPKEVTVKRLRNAELKAAGRKLIP